MRNGILLGALIVACLWPTLSVAIDGADPRDVRLTYEMDVDATGRATTLRPIRDVPAEVDAKIQARVRGFTFTPASRDGHPVPAHTTLYLTLGPIALPGGREGYGITTLFTGPRLVSGRGIPPQRRLESGSAYFVIGYDQAGDISSVALDESAPKIGGRLYYKWAKSFIQTLRFQPELVAGHPVAGRVRMPLTACYDSNCPKVGPPPPWQGQRDNRTVDDMSAESVLALQSPLEPTAI